MKDPDEELTAALKEIGGEFRAGELAYLATTIKVEHPFRDRLAYLLHQRYEPAGFIVAREWDRIDLAVLDAERRPICFVELKAMYTFDALKSPKPYTDATSADEIKARERAEPQTAVYSLLLATHLSHPIKPQFAKAVKYSMGINKALLNHQDAASVRKHAIKAVDDCLLERTVVTRGEVDGGRAFGLAVSVLYWLLRNQPL